MNRISITVERENYVERCLYDLEDGEFETLLDLAIHKEEILDDGTVCITRVPNVRALAALAEYILMFGIHRRRKMSELPKFNSVATCSKCTCLTAYTETKVKYIAAVGVYDYEFMLRACGGCGYQWKEACADAEEKKR